MFLIHWTNTLLNLNNFYLAWLQYNLSKTATLKTLKLDFQDQLMLNAGQKYCRMIQGKHSEILSTFIKLPFVIKIFILCIFEWPLKTGFAVFLLQYSTDSTTFYEHP